MKMKFNITYERDEIYQAILVEAPEAGIAADYLRDQMPNAKVLGVWEARSDDMKPGKPVLTVPDDFMTVKIEVGAIVFADNDYLEGVVVVDGDPFPFDYNIKTGEIEVHSYSAPGWLTGSSYEKPLPAVVIDNMEDILGEIQGKVDAFLEQINRTKALEKYSEKEFLAAIIAVEDILDMERFSLGERISDARDAEWEHLDPKDVVGKNVFYLHDKDGAYLGGIDKDVFFNLNDVLGRLEHYHADSLYSDYEEFAENGFDAPDPMVEKALILIENHTYIRDLLGAIDADMRVAMKEMYYGIDGEHLMQIATKFFNGGEVYSYFGCDSIGRQKFDALGYLADRSIAMKIMETQSAYQVVEFDGKICEVYVDNGDICDFKEEIENGTLLECDGVCHFESYRDYIDGQIGMILDDFRDMGLYEKDGSWGFYLTEKELCYIGLGKELAREKAEYAAEMAGELVPSVEVLLGKATEQSVQANVQAMREFLKEHDPHFATDEYLDKLSLGELAEHYRECRETVREAQRDAGDDWARRRESLAAENLGFHG